MINNISSLYFKKFNFNTKPLKIEHNKEASIYKNSTGLQNSCYPKSYYLLNNASRISFGSNLGIFERMKNENLKPKELEGLFA